MWGGLEDDRVDEVEMISFFSSPARRIWWWRSAHGFYSCEPGLGPTRRVASPSGGPDVEGRRECTDDPEKSRELKTKDEMISSQQISTLKNEWDSLWCQIVYGEKKKKYAHKAHKTPNISFFVPFSSSTAMS